MKCLSDGIHVTFNLYVSAIIPLLTCRKYLINFEFFFSFKERRHCANWNCWKIFLIEFIVKYADADFRPVARQLDMVDFVHKASFTCMTLRGLVYCRAGLIAYLPSIISMI